MTTSTFRQLRSGLVLFGGLLTGAAGLLTGQAMQPNRPAELENGQAKLSPKLTTATPTVDPQRKARILSDYGRLPLQFEANRGQADPKVQFIAHGSQYELLLLTNEIVFAMPEIASNFKSPEPRYGAKESRHKRQATVQAPVSYVSMSLPRAQLNQAVGKDKLPGIVNYFIGKDPQKWRTGIPTFATVEYPEITPGVDLDFHGIRQQSEFDLVVHPGAEVSAISLHFDGIQRARLDGSGTLSISSRSGELRLLKPVAYQEIDGKRIFVDAGFVRKKHKEIGFQVGSYDKRRELVIDPSIVYSSYLGGKSQDEALGVSLDGQDAIYLTGATSSPNFPTRFSQQGFTGTVDAFVTKLHPDGKSLDFSTFLGGSSTAFATAIAVLDQPGASQPAVYITGYTDSFDLPFPPGESQDGYQGGLDAFMCLFDLSGMSLIGGTYIGGTQDDVGTGISVDLQGYAWVVGWTNSSPAQKFPLVKPLQNKFGGVTDAFITQVAQSTVFAFSSYLGGSKQDVASAVAIDSPYSQPPQYNVYVTGETESPDFPTTPFALQKQCGTDGQCNGGKDDAFVTAISYEPGNYGYQYSTFLGGEDKDDAYGIAADASGNAYLTGQTSSIGFPTTSSAYQSSIHGPQNAFLTEINPTGTALAYSTFFGGSVKDAGLGIAVDGSDNVYVTGQTLSPDFPTLNATQTTIGGGQDAFVSAFVPLNDIPTLSFSTFLGGSGDEDLAGGGIAVDNFQNAYVAGDTNSSDFTITSGAFQKKFAGSGTCTIGGVKAPCEDAFITKIAALENPTLTVNMTGSGVAVVTSMPAGINCDQIPGTCQAKFNFGTQVTLTEQPTNTTFNGWSGGGCSGTGNCVLTLNSDQTVSADFTLNLTNVTLTVVIAGNGHGEIVSSPPGITCSKTESQGATCTGNFQQGTEITLTETADDDSTFSGWTQPASCGFSQQCVVTLNNAATVNAGFTLVEPTLTVSVTGDPSAGVVSSSPSGIDGCVPGTDPPNTCSHQFPPGTAVTLKAQALNGFVFLGWNAKNEPNCVGIGDCVVTLNSDETVGAVFGSGAEPTLSVNLDGTGSGTVISSPPGINCPQTCTGSFDMNKTVTLTATPDSSSTFNSWTGNASSCGTNTTCAVTINGLFVPVGATFDKIYVPPPPPFSLTSIPPGGSTIPVGGSAAYGLAIVSFNGFTDTINLTCTVKPASQSSPACSFTPASMTLGANQAASSTLTISAGGLAARNTGPGNGRFLSYEFMAATLMFSFVGGMWTIPAGASRKSLQRRFRAGLPIVLVILAVLAIQAGCGGGGKSSGGSASGSNAQPGNYVVTVTATGSITQTSQTITIPVTVQ